MGSLDRPAGNPSLAEATEIVHAYRARYPKISALDRPEDLTEEQWHERVQRALFVLDRIVLATGCAGCRQRGNHTPECTARRILRGME